MNKKELQQLVSPKDENLHYAFDLDCENPKDLKLSIRPTRDMDGLDLYRALYDLVHNVLEPALFGRAEDKPN